MSYTVLIVTDNDEDAQCLHTIITGQRTKFTLQRVTNLEEAVQALNGASADIIFADLHLAGSQGIRTFEWLAKACSNDATIALLVDPKEKFLAEEAVSQGAFGYVFKDRIQHATSLLLNIVRCKQAESALFSEREQARTLLNSIGDAVITADTQGKVTYLNPAAATLTGWPHSQALGEPIKDIFNILNAETLEPMPSLPMLAIQEQTVKRPDSSVMLRRYDESTVMIEDSSSPILNASKQIIGVIVVFHDVTRASAVAATMFRLAHFDPLTNLPNRLLMNDRLEQALALSRRTPRKIAVFFVDLDHFKHINDSLGHIVGDKLLQSAAHRLTRCVRKTDTVCRHGGDEFVILISDDEHTEDTAIVAEKILEAFSTPHYIDGHELHVMLSIGISIYPHHGADMVTLLKNADAAMYRAKASGRNKYEFFQHSDNHRAVTRQSTEALLRVAIRQNQFELYYQPKINLITGLISGAEALIRWHHPEKGLLAPDEFLWVAEESGLIVEIGRWVQRQVMHHASRWADADVESMVIAFNASASEFHDRQFISNLMHLLSEFSIDPRKIEIELTENVLMQDSQKTLEVLNKLKKLNFRLAIDDFGTGFSSLNYLRKFPIDTIKIDQSFVRDIVPDDRVGAIVSSMCSLAHQLSQHVVAEGVETAEQLAFLSARHCDEAQGYYFSRPLTFQDFAELVAEKRLFIVPSDD